MELDSQHGAGFVNDLPQNQWVICDMPWSMGASAIRGRWKTHPVAISVVVLAMFEPSPAQALQATNFDFQNSP